VLDQRETIVRTGVRSLYLDVPRARTFALFDAPSGSRRDTAVLFCPPFGWDELCSYRTRRVWAERLAAAGFPALRLDLPGTGDSPGSWDDERLVDAWTDAVSGAAAWLRTETGAPRVAAIGIGLGGLLAWRAAAGGAPIDDLVLWSVPARGRLFVRELRAFARLELTEHGDPSEAVAAAPLAPGGFPLADTTLAALSELDLTELPLPDASDRRVLLLDRDGLAPDAALLDTLEAAGAEVRVAPGAGYGRMIVDPAYSEPPEAVLATVETWLGEGAGRLGRPATGPAPRAAEELELDDGRELALEADADGTLLRGVLTLPPEEQDSGLTAVLVSGAAVRRIGQGRIWVPLAERWAARGVASVRFDFARNGESDGPSEPYGSWEAFYAPGFERQVDAVLAELERRGRPGRFVFVGLCSGGYWAFQQALRDDRVEAVYLLNPGALFWDAALTPAREVRRLRRELLSLGGLRKLLRLALLRERVQQLRLLLRTLRTPPPDRAARVTGALDLLHERGKQLLLVFSRAEVLRDELERDGVLAQLPRWPNVTVRGLPGVDHSLRSPAMRDAVYDALDDALDRLRDRPSDRS
jgi:alpha-beta hydrolase superfamily lysophospholipase